MLSEQGTARDIVFKSFLINNTLETMPLSIFTQKTRLKYYSSSLIGRKRIIVKASHHLLCAHEIML